ncbi:hypothetical protein EMGBS15_08590 [Filimonas sp.]|nr:hypothetical protein EMGBS15_08590 [Filimonas sp.]
MKNREQIQDELKALGVQLPDSSPPPMEIPEGYFDELPGFLLNEIHQNSFLASLAKQPPFETPPGYFDNFSSSLNEAIRQEAFLDTLPKNTTYEIPANYFDQLPAQISSRLNRVEPAIQTLTFSRRIITRLALAATLLLFMGISLKVFLLPAHTVSATGSAEAKLAGISDEEINHYLIQHQAEIESNLALESIDASDLDVQKLETEILDHTLNSISDEDLLNYTL